MTGSKLRSVAKMMVELLISPVVTVLVGLGIMKRWGDSLEHASWAQVAGILAPYAVAVLVGAFVYAVLRRRVLKVQADAAVALRVLRNPGPLHCLLRMGALSSGTFAPTTELQWEQREALKLGELLGILTVKNFPDGTLTYTWHVGEPKQLDATAAAALLASVGDEP